MDSRRARDSRVLEELGSYQPVEPKEENQITLKRERIEYWLSVGAEPSETVRNFLKRLGIQFPEKKRRKRRKKAASAS